MASCERLLLVALIVVVIVAFAHAQRRYDDRNYGRRWGAQDGEGNRDRIDDKDKCCVDRLKHCSEHARRGYCASKFHGMTRNCCSSCLELGYNMCKDSDSNICSWYSKRGYCTNPVHGAWMKEFCCQSCCAQRNRARSAPVAK